MEKILWFTLFSIIYIYFGYAFILWILSLFKKKRILKYEIFPKVTLLISAYNEENIIRKKIINSLDLDYPRTKFEIIVASESIDKTNEIVKEYQDNGVVLIAFDVREGKSATLYRTVPLAKGDIIVFSDANAIYKKDAIKKLVQNFADERIGCVSGKLQYTNPDDLNIGEGEGLYWKYEMTIKKLESKLFSLLGANGSIFALRKDLYLPMSKERGDDFELPIRVAQKGYGVVLELQAISWEETSSSAREEFIRKVRIVAWNLKSALILIKECLSRKNFFLIFQLISHKFLRWMMPLFLLLLFITSIFLLSNFLYKALFFLQLLFYGISIFVYILDKKGKCVSKLLNIPYYFCLINLASLLGIFRALFKSQGTTWKKVRI